MAAAIAPALLVPTLMSGGDVRMTLSPAADAKACEADRAQVVAILTSIGKPPLAARCGQSALRLTPFVHGTPPDAATERYRMRLLPDGGFQVAPLAPGAPCEAGPDVHCARSAQKPLP